MRGWWLVGLFCLFAACATDEIPENNDNGRNDPNACVNPCSAGETRCNGNTVEACTADTDGCLDWTSGVDCTDEDLMCDDNAEPAICLSEPGTCTDDEVNQDESDVDCGGQRCDACALGQLCRDAADCDSGNCDAGGTDQCVTPDTPTCTDGKANQDESDIDCGGATCEACMEGDACNVNEDCDTNNCDNGTCGPMVNGCTEGETQCVQNTVQTCENNAWVETQVCAQMCDQGACSDDVTCTPGENRCFKNSVQQCNVTGSAWQHLSICNETCDAGLCVGACEPNEFRCNVDQKEMCGLDGMTWSLAEDCSLGCAQQTCVEQGLVNQGVPQTMSGVHVYRDCVKIELGGTLTVPVDETLEIFGKCLEVTSSSSITLEAGARFIFHATDTVVNDGTISGGDFIQISSYGSFNNNGTVSSNFVQLRGDNLTNGPLGSIGGGTAQALYGSNWTNNGTHSGDVSVMPPVEVSSPTHPEGFTWNLNEDDVSVSWDKPFASVFGYYVSLNGTAAPSPANADFTNQENLTIPLGRFRKGINTIQVVSVNADSTVGTVSETFTIDFNISTPTLSSTSHPDQFVWTNSDDVFLEWDEGILGDPESFVGYWYAWDHNGDTHPDDVTGTFRNDDKILLNDQAPGVWSFHLSLIDRFGRTAPFPAHYQVRVGADPGTGNIAGNVTDDGGNSVLGARVRVNGGLYSTATVASGDFTFNNQIPSAAFDYEVEVSAPGFVTQVETVRINANQVEVKNFQLVRDVNPAVYSLGFENQIASGAATYTVGSDVAVGAGDEVVFGYGRYFGVVTLDGRNRGLRSVTARYGAASVGFNGSHYYASYVRNSYYRPDVAIWERGTTSISFRNFSQFEGYNPTIAWSGSDFGIFTTYSGTYLNFTTTDEEVSNYTTAVETQVQTSPVYNDSSGKTVAFWDGTGYAIAWIGYENEYAVYFARFSRDGNQIQAPVKVIDTMQSSDIGLAYDGTNYYVGAVAYDQPAQTRYPMQLASVDQLGNVNGPVELGRNSSHTQGERYVDLAFDGKNLLAVYTIDSRGKMSVIDTNTLRPTETLEIGDARNVAIDFGYHARRGAIVYQNASRQNLYLRALHVD